MLLPLQAPASVADAASALWPWWPCPELAALGHLPFAAAFAACPAAYHHAGVEPLQVAAATAGARGWLLLHLASAEATLAVQMQPAETCIQVSRYEAANDQRQVLPWGVLTLSYR